MAAGSKAVYEKFVEAIKAAGLPCSVSMQDEPEEGYFNVKKCGCIGCCGRGSDCAKGR